MQELRDAGVMLRLIYEAMKRRGIDTDAIFSRLGVNEQYVYTDQLRSPHSAQLYFWQAVEDVSGDPDVEIGRASCRERVWMSMVDVSLEKKRGSDDM